jgi:hypothetical protein
MWRNGLSRRLAAPKHGDGGSQTWAEVKPGAMTVLARRNLMEADGMGKKHFATDDWGERTRLRVWFPAPSLETSGVP